MKRAICGVAALLLAASAFAGFDPHKQVTDTNPMPISLFAGDNASTDAAGRIRQSEPSGVFEDMRTDGIGADRWEDAASGVGAGSTLNANESTVSITVGTGAGDYAYRQSRYVPYIPGKSQNVKITFVLGAGVANVAKRIGLFDDSDGLYLEQSGTTMRVCVRTSTSGSPVSTCYDQSAWNLDKMNGVGPSKLTFDATKAQLLVIDYLWQGVGRVRYGFNIAGKTYYVHEVNTANVASLPYMAQASLPVRFEIRNLDASAGATMKQICVSVESEGGYRVAGIEYAASNGITARAVTTRAPVFAIRLADTFNSRPNRKTAKLLHQTFHVSTNDALCELVHMHGVTATAGGSWVSAGDGSAVEYNAGITSVTAASSHVVDMNYLTTGLGSASSTIAESLEYINEHNSIRQNAASNASQVFAVYCTSFTGTSDIAAELNWIEEK